MPEKIEGFYLDGTKYEFDGGGTSYTAGNGINITNDEIGLDGTYEKTDYSAIQGPAQDGFHIPLITEWQGVKTIMDSLGLTTSNKWKINLHMPFTGARHYYTSESMQQGSIGYYWSSSPNSTSKVTILYLYEYDAVENRNDNRAMGFSVRCFKNSYVTPDSTWTVIQGTLGNAGIFWNQSEGLISITDGSIGYTIQDKNLGATTVWNSGTTLSEANCGKYYQWGNNYGFPFTGTVTTSSTKVNAKSYGPGNYYSSSTFIKGDFDWSSIQNDNLRGGVTGVQTVSWDIVAGDKPYKITKVKKLPTVIDASTIYFVSTPKPFGDTITISWTETSDPAQFNPIWSDGAADAEAGDERFDNWFGYSGVKLSSTGTETATASQKDGVLDITQLGTLTSGDNVMIKFPVRGIKMSKSGNVVTLSMTKELNKSGYQYYAFNRNGTIKSQLYLGAYKGSRVSNVLKSWSGQAAATSKTSDGVGYIALVNDRSGTPTAGARWSARQNNTSISTGTNGRDEITWYARNYVNALYMMKYGNPDSQSVIGNGYTGSGSVQPTGATNSITDATGATNTSRTGRIKLFGLEDRWGNCYEWLDGAYFSSLTNLNVASTNVLTNTSWSPSSVPFNTNITIDSIIGGNLKGISGTNEGMFAAIDGRGSNSTYYCSHFASDSDMGLCAGGDLYSYADAGVFNIYRSTVTWNDDTSHGSRLMFL